MEIRHRVAALIRSHWRRLAQYGIALGLVALLLGQVSISSIMDLLRQTNVVGVFLGAALYLVINIARSARVTAICCRPLRDIRPITIPMLASSFGNNVLPARAGEPIFIWAAHARLNMDWGTSTAVMVTMRVFDTLTVALVFVFTAIARHDSSSPSVLQAILWVLGGCIALTASLPWLGRYLVGAAIFLARLTHQPRLMDFARREGSRAADAFTQLRSMPVYGRVVLTSLAVWAMTFGWIYLLIRSIGIDIPIDQAIMGSTFGILSKAIPFSSIGGWGAHEAGWTAGFMLTGMPRELAISSGFAVNTLIILTSAVCGLPAWLALTRERKHETAALLSVHEETHPRLDSSLRAGDRVVCVGDSPGGD